MFKICIVEFCFHMFSSAVDIAWKKPKIYLCVYARNLIAACGANSQGNCAYEANEYNNKLGVQNAQHTDTHKRGQGYFTCVCTRQK